MPELPEVESLAAFLRDRAVGRTIARFDVVAFTALKTHEHAPTQLVGRNLEAVGRHGKFLDLRCVADDGQQPLHLVTHLARAGWLRWRDELPDKPPRPGKSPLAARIGFSDGSGFDLTEAGTQKRLALYLVDDVATVPGVAQLGPDPLVADFTIDALRTIMAAAGRAQLKGVLTDQKRLAGVGNAYSDEILHRARLSPFKPASGLTETELEALYGALRDILTDAVDRSAGLAAKDLKSEKKTGMAVHGRAGQACPVCGDTVREVSFADSSLQYCPSCQTGGKPLADRRLSKLLK